MSLIEQLAAVVGPSNVLTGTDVSSRSAGWMRGNRSIEARAIVRPANTDEVAAILRLCHEAGQPLVLQGGLTGLVDGALAGPQEIVLSTERMNAIEEIDPVSSTMTLQTGVTLQRAQEAAEELGFVLPLDLGARGSATIGGNISTNAGGNRVIRYGTTRDMVLGLEVVLADGRVMTSLGKVMKDNAGYDLKQLFIGTEGTLGVVTRAVLRLRPQPTSQQTAFVACDSFDRMPALLTFLNRNLGGRVTAFEAMWNNFYSLVSVGQGKNPPLSPDYPFYVLIEAMGGDEAADQEGFEAVLGKALEEELIVDAVITKSKGESEQLWGMRDDVGASRRAWGAVIGFDISLPAPLMEEYLAAVDDLVTARFPERHHLVFGHLGDGNLHLSYAVGSGDPETRDFIERCVYEPLGARGGSISAEHGIGMLKKPYLGLTRSETAIGMMRQLKGLFDPKGILNPGRVI